jgi:hypothetical protein
VVATRFYPGAQGSLTTFSSRPFGLNERRHSNCKPLCLCSLSESRDSVRRPLVGLDGRDRRDGMVYTENKFSGQSSVCFIFQRLIYFICRRENPEFFRKVLAEK